MKNAFGILLYETWQIITCNKWRSFLTAVGVFWGVFILISLMAGGTLISNIYDNLLDSFNNHTLYIKTLPTTKPYAGYSEGRNVSLSDQDLETLKQLQNIGVEKIGCNMTLGKDKYNPVTYGQYSDYFYVSGVNSVFLECFPMLLMQGSKITDHHDAEHSPVCMIGDEIVSSLFPNKNPIGEYITVFEHQFMIIGVCRSVSPIANSIDPSHTVFIPLNLSRLLFKTTYSEIRSIFFLFNEDIDVDSKIDECRNFISNLKDVDPTDTQSICIFNIAKLCEQSNIMKVGLLIITVLGGVGMLFAGIVGVSSIILVTVKERTRDIAIRSVLGASKWDICKLIISESMFITVISGILGFCSAEAMIQLARHYLPIFGIESNYLYLPFSFSVFSLMIIIIGGFTAAVYPLYRALSVQVIVALSNE